MGQRGEGDRAVRLLRDLEKEILALREENAQLKEQLELALRCIPVHPESPDHQAEVPPHPPHSRPRSGSGTEARLDEKKPGRKVSKKLQKAYQASTNRIVSTFARHEPHVIEGVRTNTLHGHTDGVWSVCSAVVDGIDLVASASADRSCCVWLANSGSPIAHYTGHRASVNAVQLLDPGQQAAHFVGLSGGGDGLVHRWLVDRECANPRTIGLTVGRGVAEHQDAQGAHGVVIKQPDLTFVGHSGPVSALALCHDNHVLSGSHDATARLWDITRGTALLKLPGHEQEVTDICCHPHRRFAITSSRDATFRMWDFRQWSIREVSVCQGHTDAVNSTAIVTDHLIASTSEDSSLKLWDLRKMRSPVRVVRLNTPGNKMAVSPTKRQLALPSDSGSVKIYDVHTGARLGRIPKRRAEGHRRAVCCVDWLSDDRLISAGFDHMLMVWQLKSYERHAGLRHRRREPSTSGTATQQSTQSAASTATAAGATAGSGTTASSSAPAATGASHGTGSGSSGGGAAAAGGHNTGAGHSESFYGGGDVVETSTV